MIFASRLLLALEFEEVLVILETDDGVLIWEGLVEEILLEEEIIVIGRFFDCIIVRVSEVVNFVAFFFSIQPT